MKIPNKRELQKSQLIIHQKVTIKIILKNEKCTAKPYSFLVIDTTLISDNPLRLRHNILERT